MHRVGIFGLGNMGDALASRLSTVGDVVAYDPDRARADAAGAAHGITIAAQPADVTADLIVLSLPSPDVSRSVVETVVSAGTTPGLIIETSTVNPDDVRSTARIARDRGWSMIDAAILSGVGQMYAGTATLLIGGDEHDIARAEPVLAAISARRTRFGDLGTGMAAKVINNAVAHAVMVVLAEAGALAVANGIDGTDLSELLNGPEAGLTRPLTHRFVERILRGSYDGGMPTEAARKDSTLALALAQRSGVPLFAIGASHTVYELAVNEGLARRDYAVIAKLWERWTGRSMLASAALETSGRGSA